MKKYALLYFSIFSLILISCGENSDNNPIIVNQDDGDQPSNIALLQDTTMVQIANLPIQFDSTNVLMHISGLIRHESIEKGLLDNLTSSYDKRKSSYEDNFYANKISNDNLSGWFTNIFFDNPETNEQRLLTQNILFINRISYLRELGKKKGKHYLLYSVYDKDTNGDGKIDMKDLRSLYISKLDGSDFKKITKPGHIYSQGIYTPNVYRYYFISLEDINQNGNFDKNDKYHYYFIDFSGDNYSIVEYNPLNTIIEQERK